MDPVTAISTPFNLGYFESHTVTGFKCGTVRLSHTGVKYEFVNAK